MRCSAYQARGQAFGFHNLTQGKLTLEGVQSQMDVVVLDPMGREVLTETIEAGQQTVESTWMVST